jgi:hypothetical protein
LPLSTAARLRLTIRIIFTLFAVLVGFAGASPESWAYLKEPSSPACNKTGDLCPVGTTVKFQTPSISAPSTVRALRIALFREVAETAGDSVSLQRRYFGLAGTLQRAGTTSRGGVFTQTDPMPLGAGSSYEASYAYGRNTPTVYTDPSGNRAVAGANPCAGKVAPKGYYGVPYIGACMQVPNGHDAVTNSSGAFGSIPSKYCKKGKCVVRSSDVASRPGQLLPASVIALPGLGGAAGGTVGGTALGTSAMTVAVPVAAVIAASALLAGDSEQDPWETYYHGSTAESIAALIGGAPLSLEVALSKKIDGPAGFYMATKFGDAEYFGSRRDGGVVPIRMRRSTTAALMEAGARIGPIPGGRFPVFEGLEFFIPPSVFGLFDEFRRGGQIRVGR